MLRCWYAKQGMEVLRGEGYCEKELESFEVFIGRSVVQNGWVIESSQGVAGLCRPR